MNRKGFTLIELLVVIAIIALLMSVIVPSLKKAKDAAKLMLCANNQHQTLSGVFAYAADNNGAYPPHPAERIDGSFSVVNYINYHQGAGAAQNAKNQGTYYYLGSYLPTVDVFVCPLGRAKGNSELQRQYVNYKDSGEGTLTSYNLFWGGIKFSLSDGRTFEGNRGKGGKLTANLLVSDSVFNWPGAVNDWWLAHKPSKGSGQFQDYDRDPTFGNYCAEFWIYNPDVSRMPTTGELSAEIAELKMNAGYTDGSVIRYTGSEVVWTIDKMHYIPTKWR